MPKKKAPNSQFLSANFTCFHHTIIQATFSPFFFPSLSQFLLCHARNSLIHSIYYFTQNNFFLNTYCSLPTKILKRLLFFFPLPLLLLFDWWERNRQNSWILYIYLPFSYFLTERRIDQIVEYYMLVESNQGSGIVQLCKYIAIQLIPLDWFIFSIDFKKSNYISKFHLFRSTLYFNC